mgnify:CR=1 FL=1
MTDELAESRHTEFEIRTVAHDYAPSSSRASGARSFGTRDRSADDKLHRWIHHVNLAHGAAVDALRDTVADPLIGLVTNYQPVYPSSDRPEDVAEAITFLATPGAIGITGSVLRVCGGALIGA